MSFKDNPFFILNVMPEEEERSISAKADAYALLIDSDTAEKAKKVLLNPKQRLSAEIRWFLDCGKDDIQRIEKSIEIALHSKENTGLSWEQYSPLSQLIVQYELVHNQPVRNVEKMTGYILGVNRLYDSINIGKLTSEINTKRRAAELPQTFEDEVQTEMNVLRTEICDEISKSLQCRMILSNEINDRYHEVISAIAESYESRTKNAGSKVLEDLIKDYMQFEDESIQKKTRDLVKLSDYFQKGIKDIDTKKATVVIMRKLEDWQKTVNPIQMYYQSIGSRYETSREVLLSLRRLANVLFNDYGRAGEAYLLTEALQNAFKNEPYCSVGLANDVRMIEGNVDAEQLKKEMRSYLFSSIDRVDQFGIFLPLIRKLAGWDKGVLARLIGEQFAVIDRIEKGESKLSSVQYYAMRYMIDLKISAIPQETKELSELVEILCGKTDIIAREESVKKSVTRY